MNNGLLPGLVEPTAHFRRLNVGPTDNPTTVQNIMSVVGDYNDYFGPWVANTNSGATASTDIVMGNGNTARLNDPLAYVDIGMNGYNNTNPFTTFLGAGDAYLFTGGSANIGGIDIASGNTSPIKFAVGGLLAANEIMRLTTTGPVFRMYDGWVSAADQATWTYSSASAFTIAGTDYTAVFTPGTRLKFTQTTVKYAVVASSTFSGGNTTVNIIVNTDYTIANAVISANSYSYQANPQGYPGWFVYAQNPTGFSSTTLNTGRYSVNGRTVTVQVVISGTSNSTAFGFSLPVAAGASSFNLRVLARPTDNGSIKNQPAIMETAANSATVICDLLLNAADGWTNSGTKQMVGMIVYEM